MFSYSVLPKPFFALAPMEDVTDTVMRRMVKRIASSDVMFTEFTNVDGLLSEGREKVAERLVFDESERPLIAQIWGSNPAAFREVARDIVRRGFDGLDINMGCPQKDIMKTGGGAALIGNEKLVKEIVESVRLGMEDAGKLIPFSIKTRIGNREIVTRDWIGFLLTLNLDAISIHGRTAKAMSKGVCHIDELALCVEMRNKLKSESLIIANGDILSRSQGLELAQKHGFDGLMIGRGVLYNPWVFEKTPKDHAISERINIFREHLMLFDQVWGGKKHFAIIKKFAKMYISGFDNASDLRQKIMEFDTSQETINFLNSL